MLSASPSTSSSTNDSSATTLFLVDDYLLIIFASQLLVMALGGLILANKNLFLFLLNLEIVYLAGGLSFAAFSVYWFYDARGVIFAFLTIVLAGAESVVGLALMIVLRRRNIDLDFFSEKEKKKKPKFLFPRTFRRMIILAVVPVTHAYLNFLLFFFFILTFFLILVLILNRIIARTPSVQKATSYECGFEPFGDARLPFQVQFYTIGLSFLIFDLELMFLIPWVMSLSVIGIPGRLTMLFFFVILVIGFYYEWTKKALNIMHQHLRV